MDEPEWMTQLLEEDLPPDFDEEAIDECIQERLRLERKRSSRLFEQESKKKIKARTPEVLFLWLFFGNIYFLSDSFFYGFLGIYFFQAGT
jgi:hypothetical protein